MKPVVTAQNLSFSYGDTPIFNQVSFSIQEGEWIGIIGPNGGGKIDAP